MWHWALASATLVAALAVTSPARAETIILFAADAPAGDLAFNAIDDRVMGGVSRSRMGVSGTGTLVFEGHVSLESGGGFASVRSSPLTAKLGGTSALMLVARGDGKRYKLSLRTDENPDGVQYQASFVAPATQWREIVLPFGEFVPVFRGRPVPAAPPLDPAAITTIGVVIADRQAGGFRLEIRRIAAVRDRRAASDSR